MDNNGVSGGGQIIPSCPDTPGTPLYLPLSLRHTTFFTLTDKKQSKRIDTIDKNDNKKQQQKGKDRDDGRDNETIKEDLP